MPGTRVIEPALGEQSLSWVLQPGGFWHGTGFGSGAELHHVPAGQLLPQATGRWFVSVSCTVTFWVWGGGRWLEDDKM